MRDITDILESGVGRLGRLRERVLSRHRGRRAPLEGITITNARGMPGMVSLTVTTDVITQDYQLRRFSCNGAQFGALNEGIFPEGMPQDMVDAINFTLELHRQGHGAYEQAVARAQIHMDRQDMQDTGR